MELETVQIVGEDGSILRINKVDLDENIHQLFTEHSPKTRRKKEPLSTPGD